MPDAVVQVVAFQSPEMVAVLEALAEQSTPSRWSMDREVWVRLDPPDRELCTTWQAALEARGFDAVEAPAGSALDARNAAHDRAVERGADVVVEWPVGTPPRSDSAVASLLGEFEDDETVGVQDDHGAFAFRASAWDAAGPIEGASERRGVRSFRDRVSDHGRVVGRERGETRVGRAFSRVHGVRRGGRR